MRYLYGEFFESVFLKDLVSGWWLEDEFTGESLEF